MIEHTQLLRLGLGEKAIRHRLDTGRLHPTWRGVYAVARRDLTREGWWMAALLACGDGACLSHESAAQLWGIRPRRGGPIHVTVPPERYPRHEGIRTHRRSLRDDEITEHARIPTTIPLIALTDLAATLQPKHVERAVGEADLLGLTNPERLRREAAGLRRMPGVGKLKRLLDRHTYVLTHSELERLFVAIARRAGLGPPLTQVEVNGYRVDFYWPELGLIVETDGLTYHRTPAQQAADLKRDHAHAARGIRTLRFSHAQVRYEPAYVEAALAAAAAAISGGATTPEALGGAAAVVPACRINLNGRLEPVAVFVPTSPAPFP